MDTDIKLFNPRMRWIYPCKSVAKRFDICFLWPGVLGNRPGSLLPYLRLCAGNEALYVLPVPVVDHAEKEKREQAHGPRISVQGKGQYGIEHKRKERGKR